MVNVSNRVAGEQIDHRGGWLIIMWYKIRARDNGMNRPDGFVLTFHLSAENQAAAINILTAQGFTEIKILDEYEEHDHSWLEK